MTLSFKTLLSLLADGQKLSSQQAMMAFEALLSNEVSAAQAGAFLMALRLRGESVDEITGAVKALRQRMVPVAAPENAIDIVGTGGDHSGSYNISTLAALIAASCGVKVAKHGNRAASSKSGAADVLEALGIVLSPNPATLSRCLDKAHLCFMFAQNHHASMRHVAPVRGELGLRTIFNLIGPLSNPAGVKRQVLGVFHPQWLEPLTRVLADLGSAHVWAVHGADGLDEITTTGTTQIVAFEKGDLRSFTLDPRDYGLPLAKLEDIKGGDPQQNSTALRRVLEGERNAYRDIALLNAAAALIVGGVASDIGEGLTLAAKAIDDGRTKATLDKLITVSQGAE
jgi:anthranilate phosphoribosyltransferase